MGADLIFKPRNNVWCFNSTFPSHLHWSNALPSCSSANWAEETGVGYILNCFSLMCSLIHFQIYLGKRSHGRRCLILLSWVLSGITSKKINATEARLSTPLRVSKGTQLAPRIINKTFPSPQWYHICLNIMLVNQKVTFLRYLTSQLHDAKSSEVLIRSRGSRKCWYTSRLPADAQELAGWQPVGWICFLAQFHLLCYAFKGGGKCLTAHEAYTLSISFHACMQWGA